MFLLAKRTYTSPYDGKDYYWRKAVDKECKKCGASFRTTLSSKDARSSYCNDCRINKKKKKGGKKKR